MNAKIQLFAASAIACLTSGCIMPPPYYPSGPVEYGRPVYGRPMYDGPVEVVPAEEIYVPDVIIVEGGVRHDRFFYQRHPEFYRRDQQRYPDRFAHMPSRRGREDSKDKKHHDDHDHDR